MNNRVAFIFCATLATVVLGLIVLSFNGQVVIRFPITTIEIRQGIVDDDAELDAARLRGDLDDD